MRSDSADSWMLLRAQEIWRRLPGCGLRDVVGSLFLRPICSLARRLYKLVAALCVIGVLMHFMVMQSSKKSRVAAWAALSLALVLGCWLRKQTAIVIFLES